MDSGRFNRVPPRKQNLVLFLFTPAAERLFPDIHPYRRAIVAALRYQYVRHIGSERFGAVITTLLETGPGPATYGRGTRLSCHDGTPPSGSGMTGARSKPAR